ncbi:glycosyltransferase [Pseudonocardia asaccharolytica]|uniref:Glycosyl transferase n=1 Tax=Pseudonocardia asaccharolytica DSM 44247 = NBRC 16224 TaxID=1123024 RepID=A0A511CV81_9PSEU|nr:glycosyltransferase [Pseudonocardia asaccharolytica]GEL16480.1 glycosyl transferase [Pseudonocardia asaccharolytica DSM 44247 = NBRC 16224]
MPGSPGSTETQARTVMDAAMNDVPAPSAAAAPAPPPEPTARLVIQRGLCRGPSALVPEDLYCVVEWGGARRERHRVELAPASQVSTNTYFGRVHATYWQRWTDVTEVEVSMRASGSGRIRVLASDTNKVWRIVAAYDVADAQGAAVRLNAPIDRFVDGGGLWLEFTTETGELAVSDVRWTVPAPAVRPVSVVICTYNRVEDGLNTLQALADDPEPLATVDLIYVVDQGSDPLESRPRFADVAARLGDRLRYIRQPNLGGAGGFTRGLFEVAGAGDERADVVFMDDDVLLEPEILIRLTAFANRTTHPTIVGGQMLNLLHPGHLHISAEYADPELLLVGLPVPGALKEAYLLGLDERRLPIVQERRVDTEYNGWWSCLIPAEIVDAIGYPLPLFFQWDDVEFGYRARAHGFPTVALPGAGVWHADFGWKDWDEWHRYFNIRNGLITAALHTGFSVRRIGRRVGQLLAQYLVGMQYGLSATLLQAVEDFLDGPEILDDGSAAAAARIRQIRAAYPETVMHPISEGGNDFRDMQVVRAANPPGKERLTWLKRAVFHATGRSVHRTGMVPAGDAHWWHVSNFERAVVTDMSEQGIRIRTRDRALALELAKRGARVLRRLAVEGPSVVERYRAAQPRLTSRENWARLYGLDQPRPPVHSVMEP